MMIISSVIYTLIVVLMLLVPLKNKDITIGEFISLFYALQTLSNISKDFCNNLFTVCTNSKRSKAYSEFMALEEECENKEISGIETVEFKGVSFSYPGSDILVLNNISFKLSKGKHYALVGENGFGKTTLINVILGLYESTKGSVLYDGSDIGKYKEEDIHKNQSTLSQNFIRYQMSVSDNIKISNFSKHDDEYIQDGILRYFHGKVLQDTLLGKEFGGIELSGGEW